MLGELNVEEASELTIQIRTSSKDLARLVKEAWAGQAWKVLGFESFDAWTQASFGWHRSRAYQLINIATLNEEIHATIRLPETWTVSDRQTRKIIAIGVVEFLNQLRDNSSEFPEENEKLVNQLISRLTTLTESRQDPEPSSAPLITRSSPSTITNGLRNSRTALVMANSLEQQTKLFPEAQTIAPQVRVQVLETLQQAATEARKRLDAFNEAVAHREASVVVNAE